MGLYEMIEKLPVIVSSTTWRDLSNMGARRRLVMYTACGDSSQGRHSVAKNSRRSGPRSCAVDDLRGASRNVEMNPIAYTEY